MQLANILKKFGIPLLSLAVFVGFLWILKQELQEYSYQDIIDGIQDIGTDKVRLATLLTIVGYGVIAQYDRIAFAAAGYSLSNSIILTTTFLSYAICNSLGFMLVIGGGIRYYFYRRYGVPKEVIAIAIAFSNLNFWLGLFALGGIVFVLNPLTIPPILNSQFVTVRPLGYIFLAIIAVYLCLSFQQRTISFRGQRFALPKLRISLAQIGVSAVDWAIASGVLFLLLPAQNELDYGSFFGIYLLAIAAKVISNVPGGLGVFEATIIAFMPSEVTSASVASLLVYRGVYLLLPLLIALILFGIFKLKLSLER